MRLPRHAASRVRSGAVAARSGPPAPANFTQGSLNPAADNFAITAAGPAIGYGLAQSYLPSQALDAGACDHRLSAFP